MQGERTLEVDGVRWWLRSGVEPAALAPLLARALGELAAATDLRCGRRKRLFRLALGAAPGSVHLLKRSGYPFARGWLRRVDGSKARRELAIAEALAARAVPVIVPLAAGERRRWGRVVECFLLVPFVAQARDLRVLWRDPELTARERRRLLVSLGGLIRLAHAAGLQQDDLAPNNVLVCGGAAGALRLVDFERARLRRRLGARARRRALAKLARSAEGVAAAQRLRFLRAYAGARGAARLWWARLRDESPRLARRDVRRLRRSATRDGRRFARVARGGWRGYARRGAPADGWLGTSRAAPAPAEGAARVELAGGLLRVVERRHSARQLRRLWARAHALAARGLSPPPLAAVSDSARTLFLFEAGSGLRPLGALAWDALARCALVRLLSELAALGELCEELEPAMFVLVPDAAGRPRALLIAPHALRFGGRAGGARSRAAVARLLARLDVQAGV